jgi:hypothetical protein
MIHLPTWVPGFLAKLFEIFFPKRPHLTVEIHEVCDDKILASIDASGYTVDLQKWSEHPIGFLDCATNLGCI